jgi:RNA polymerase sigma-70 factor (ECF subfamily)
MQPSVTVATSGSQAESDEAALVRAAVHDATAFAALYQRYVAHVYRFVRLRCASSDEAADLTQHVFLKVAEALPRYRERGLPFVAWLFRITRNATIDHARRRRPAAPLESLAGVLAADDVEEYVLDRERRTALATLMGALSRDERELLSLRFAAGLSSREIAAVVGASESAVKKRLTRLIHRMKERARG